MDSSVLKFSDRSKQPSSSEAAAVCFWSSGGLFLVFSAVSGLSGLGFISTFRTFSWRSSLLLSITGVQDEEEEEGEEVSTLGNMLTLLWSQVSGVRSSCPAWKQRSELEFLFLKIISDLTLDSLLVLWPCSSMSARLTRSPLSCLCWSLLAGDRSEPEPEPASAPPAHCLPASARDQSARPSSGQHPIGANQLARC